MLLTIIDLRIKHLKLSTYLINTKKEIKTIAIKDEFDENIKNIIIEADKSFDNVNIVKQNKIKVFEILFKKFQALE